MNLKATNKTETNKYELEIEISAEDFNKAIDEVFKTEGKKIAIPASARARRRRRSSRSITASPCSLRARWTGCTARR